MQSESDTDLVIRQTEAAMDALEALLPDTLAVAPEATRATFNNALLNIAVNRIVAMEGAATTAGILWRLTEAVASGRRPHPGRPVDLSGLDG